MRPLALALLLALASALPADAAPPGGGALGRSVGKARARIEALDAATADALVTTHNFSGLSHFVGALPDRCEPLNAKKRICSWAVYRRMSGYGWLAATVGTDDMVNLVCELPNDDSPRLPESCTVSAPGTEWVRW
jgi:hypothetical protein